jgi:transcriptional regulator with XRE-family HTH domain
MKLEELAGLTRQKRGNMGVRAAASEIGISPTTLSRIENGHVPDMQTLDKVCSWIGRDPSQFSGIGGLQIAFKKKGTVKPATAKSLAALIEHASRKFAAEIETVGH